MGLREGIYFNKDDFQDIKSWVELFHDFMVTNYVYCIMRIAKLGLNFLNYIRRKLPQNNKKFSFKVILMFLLVENTK